MIFAFAMRSGAQREKCTRRTNTICTEEQITSSVNNHPWQRHKDIDKYKYKYIGPAYDVATNIQLVVFSCNSCRCILYSSVSSDFTVNIEIVDSEDFSFCAGKCSGRYQPPKVQTRKYQIGTKMQFKVCLSTFIWNGTP